MPRKLTLHVTKRSDGRVAKRIDGIYVTWPDEETARGELVELIRRRDAGVATGTVPAMPTDPPLRIIANAFRLERKSKVKPGTWADYETAIDQFLGCVGKFRRVSDLAPADFAKARQRWASTLGPWKLDSRVQAVRTMFRWAARVSRLTTSEPWYGDAFHKTTAAEKRKVRREHVAEHGERKFTKDELKQILANAKGPLRAFVLLALNCGMYAADIAQLRHADVRTEKRLTIIDNDREKTGVRRLAVLWPETVEAIESLKRGDELAFITAHGNAWVSGTHDSIGLLFRRLLKHLKTKRQGVGFGSLRHTHVSAVGDNPDINAARLVRGHKFSGIESHYDFPDIARVKVITDLARARLLTSVLRAKRTPPKSSARSQSQGAQRRGDDHSSSPANHPHERGKRSLFPCRC